jgi:membrane protease subunit HflK
LYLPLDKILQATGAAVPMSAADAAAAAAAAVPAVPSAPAAISPDSRVRDSSRTRDRDTR